MVPGSTNALTLADRARVCSIEKLKGRDDFVEEFGGREVGDPLNDHGLAVPNENHEMRGPGLRCIVRRGTDRKAGRVDAVDGNQRF